VPKWHKLKSWFVAPFRLTSGKTCGIVPSVAEKQQITTRRKKYMNDRNAIAIAVQARVPVLAWGAPGVGKTAYMKQLASILNRELTTVMASVREPQDFAGLPIIDQANREVYLAPPGWAKNLKEDAIVFFDEISTTAPATQAPLLRTIHEKTVGDDCKLPDTCSIVAAANPPDQAAGGWELAPPLANRFFHVDWQFIPAKWSQGFLSGFPDPEIPRLPAEWKKHLPQSRGVIAAFINKRPSLALEVPKDEAKASRAWPSPRSWEMASLLMAAGKSVGADDDLMNILIGGCIGEGPALEFTSWLKELDLPDPELILKDPDSIVLPKRGDRAYAVLASVISAVAGHNTEPRWVAACKAVAVAGKQSQDVAAQALFSLSPIKPSGAKTPSELHYLLKLFAAANVSKR
jgi:hypothetical protein